MKRIIPDLQNDADAERFVDEADLSQYDLSGFIRTRFEFEPKAAQLNMRLPSALLEAVKAAAKVRGIPYTRFVRETLEREITRERG